MRIAEASVRKPIFATMMVAALIVFGIISYGNLGVDQMPKVDFPIVTIRTILPGADPETIDLTVTDPIEEAVYTINGIDEITSTSYESLSLIVVQFELEKNIDVVTQEVRDKIAGIRQQLPSQIEEPIIEKLDFNALPILTVGLFGEGEGEEAIRRITEYAKRNIKERLQSINGVGSIELIGGQEREVRVWLRGDDLNNKAIPLERVVLGLQQSNVEMPGGRVESQERESTVKIHGDFDLVREFEDVVIARDGDATVRLRDIADVEDGMEDLRSLSLLREFRDESGAALSAEQTGKTSRRAVALEIRKVSGANTVALAHAVKDELEKIKQFLPEDMSVVIVRDNSVWTEAALKDVQSELMIGGGLAVLVIFFFLRNFRTSLVSALAIPTSIISTFTLLNFMGFTLNMLTMLALTISVGMLVDDAVVVLENIYRHMEREKKDRVRAAKEATAEIGLAVVSNTSAILAVFVPVAFMTGIVGRFFYEFGLTVAFAVTFSLLISLTLTPMLCSKILVVRREEDRFFLARWIGWLLGGLDKGYRWMLGLALRFRWVTLLVAICIFIGSMWIARFIPAEFQPPFDQGHCGVALEAPLGSSLSVTKDLSEGVVDRVGRMEGVRYVYSTIGGGLNARVNEAGLFVKLVGVGARDFTQQQFMDRLRAELANLPEQGVKFAVNDASQSGAGFADYDINYSLRGSNLDQLDQYAKALRDKLAAVPGFVDLDTSYDVGQPQVGIYLKRNRADQQTVPVYSVAMAINAFVGGIDVTTFRSGGEQYDVRLRLRPEDRDEVSDLEKIRVFAGNGRLIKLSSVVDIVEETGPIQINRRDRMREIRLLANLSSDVTLGQGVQLVNAAVAEVNMPPEIVGMHVGMAEVMQESFQNMFFTLFLAIILIYMVLASQFNSLVHPLTIMFSLPLSFSGAFGLLLLTGKTISILSLIGIIMLMGIVTKNAILLVDYTNTLRGRGMARNEAILTAGPRRLQPILMTALSTILGSLPVALGIGEGAAFRSAMGITVIGGLVTSTFLTLLVVPAVYTLLDDLGGAFKWIFRLRKAEGREPEPAIEAASGSGE